jgi:AcrR family transcriptional regulator
VADPVACPVMTPKPLAHRSDREIAIIRATYRMMAGLGSHRLTLRDIAADAGVSKALLLYHFGTKEALIHAAMRWALEGTTERIRRRIEPGMKGKEAITALLDAVFVSAEANRDFYLFYLDLIEYSARVPEFDELSTMLTEIINGLYAEVIEAGVRDGSFQVVDAQLAARHMRALIEGTFLQWMETETWRENHGAWRDDCRAAILTLLGA